MARSQLQIKGVVSNPVYEEGSSYSLVNIRNKNGGLVPVPKRKIVRSFEHRFDIIYLHQVNDLERLVGVVFNSELNVSTIYFEKDNGTFTDGVEVYDKITGISQTGYILSFVGLKDIYYARYDSSYGSDNHYVFLGELPVCPPIRFRAVDFYFKKMLFDDYNYTDGLNKKNMHERIKALAYKAKEKNREDKKYLFYDAVIIRYALRLYDGSLVRHSAPLLIMPPYASDMGLWYIVNTGNGGDSIGNGRHDNKAQIRLAGFNIEVLLDGVEKSIKEEWKDVISSIDIFISKPVGIINIENVITEWKFDNSGGTDNFAGSAIKTPFDEYKSLVEATSNFYLFKSLDLFDDKTDYENFKLLKSDSDLTRYDNIIYQDEMSDDNLSNHKFGAEVSYSYNKRLHLARITTNLFNGFSYKYFMYPYQPMEHIFSEKAWEGDDDSRAYFYGVTLGYNGLMVKDTLDKEDEFPLTEGNIESTIIEVTIDTGLGKEKLYSFFIGEYGQYPVFAGGMISYPDIRATNMRIICVEKGSRQLWLIGDFKLEVHPSLNLAYYIETEAYLSVRSTPLLRFYGIAPIINYYKPKKITDLTYEELIENDLLSGKNAIRTLEENKIKVSELNNPMLYPNKNTYTVSNGRILNMATNAMRVSEGQFGQYPLYVFTTKGIYALNVGGADSVYSNVDIPVSFDVATNPNLCSTNNGVVFVSDRGLKFISGGQQVELLTQAIEPLVQKLNYRLAKSIEEDYLIIRNKRNFLDNLKHIDAIAFNSLENEIIVSLDDTYLNYVISLNTGMIWISTEDFHTVVQNSYPYLLVLNDKDMIDYQLDAIDDAEVNIQLLPCSFATTDFKRLERLIARGNIEVPSKLFLGVFSSLDNTNFNLCRGAIIKAGKYKDFDMGAITSNKARQYGLVLSGWLNKMSRLDFLDLEISKELDTDKQR